MPGVRVDGIDVFAVHETAAAAVARARAGDGPSLIEAVTLRMHGHAEHDPADYVPRELKEEWAKRDPVQEAGARSSHPYQRHATAQVVGVAPHTEIGMRCHTDYLPGPGCRTKIDRLSSGRAAHRRSRGINDRRGRPRDLGA